MRIETRGRKPHNPPEVLAKVVDMWNAGHTVNEIKDALGIKYKAVFVVIVKLGGSPLKRSREPKPVHRRKELILVAKAKAVPKPQIPGCRVIERPYMAPGQVIGCLTLGKPTGRNADRYVRMWECLCDCGELVHVDSRTIMKRYATGTLECARIRHLAEKRCFFRKRSPETGDESATCGGTD